MKRRRFLSVLLTVAFAASLLPEHAAADPAPSMPAGGFKIGEETFMHPDRQGRAYRGFGVEAISSGEGECLVIQIGTQGFAGSLECAPSSVDPQTPIERSQTIVPYAFYARRYIAMALGMRTKGRNYEGFGVKEKDDGNAHLFNMPYGIWGVGLKKNPEVEKLRVERSGLKILQNLSLASRRELKPGVFSAGQEPPGIVPLPEDSFPSRSTLERFFRQNPSVEVFFISPVQFVSEILVPVPEQTVPGLKEFGPYVWEVKPLGNELMTRSAVERRFFSSRNTRGGADATGAPDEPLRFLTDRSVEAL